MLQGKRSQAFIRFVREFGALAFVERLRLNRENGIQYDTNAKRTKADDYDKCETEQDVMDLLSSGMRGE